MGTHIRLKVNKGFHSLSCLIHYYDRWRNTENPLIFFARDSDRRGACTNEDLDESGELSDRRACGTLNFWAMSGFIFFLSVGLKISFKLCMIGRLGTSRIEAHAVVIMLALTSSYHVNLLDRDIKYFVENEVYHIWIHQSPLIGANEYPIW